MTRRCFIKFPTLQVVPKKEHAEKKVWALMLCRIHTVSAGRGKGKPLMLFLHGFPELWFSWRKQMQQFKDDYEVLSP